MNAMPAVIVVGFKNKENPSLHAVATSDPVFDVVLSGQKLEAHVGYGGVQGYFGSVKTSDGRHHLVKSTAAKPFELLNWTLIVEHWDPPSPLTDRR